MRCRCVSLTGRARGFQQTKCHFKANGNKRPILVASFLGQILQTYVNVNVLYLSGLQVNYEMFSIDKTPRVKKFGDLA